MREFTHEGDSTMGSSEDEWGIACGVLRRSGLQFQISNLKEERGDGRVITLVLIVTHGARNLWCHHV